MTTQVVSHDDAHVQFTRKEAVCQQGEVDRRIMIPGTVCVSAVGRARQRHRNDLSHTLISQAGPRVGYHRADRVLTDLQTRVSRTTHVSRAAKVSWTAFFIIIADNSLQHTLLWQVRLCQRMPIKSAAAGVCRPT